jgi:hypothetical protein
MSTEGFDEAIQRATRLPEVLLVAGERHERDQGKALTMSALLPSTTITVPGAANHNVLFDVWKAGRAGRPARPLARLGQGAGRLAQPDVDVLLLREAH